VFIPKYRKKRIYGGIRRFLGRILRTLAEQRESLVEEGHLMPDHVHMMISIPSKYSVSQVIGYIKGKSAIQIAREFAGRKKNFVGQHFWARGYFVSTVGRDEGDCPEDCVSGHIVGYPQGGREWLTSTKCSMSC